MLTMVIYLALALRGVHVDGWFILPPTSMGLHAKKGGSFCPSLKECACWHGWFTLTPYLKWYSC